MRRVLEDEDYAGDDLLAPTRLYLGDVRRLRHVACAGFAHVTGGGILGNLARVVPDGLRAEIDWDAWERPPVFEWLARHVAEDELRRVFNLGIGYIAVVRDPGDELVIGRIAARDRSAGERRRDEPPGAPRRRAPGRRRRVERRGCAVRSRRAEAAGVAAAAFPLDAFADRGARDAAMADWLDGAGVELVVCAGYMHLLTAAFLARFPGRVVNVHPAPLPEFPGPHPLEDVLASGATAAAATVHYVDEGVDTAR